MSEALTISPAFAREAAQLLHDGYVQRATELSLAGTRTFPKYATGFLILGKCYSALGKLSEALDSFQTALRLLPDHAMLKELVQSTREKLELQLRQQPAESTFVELKSEPAPSQEDNAAKPTTATAEVPQSSELPDASVERTEKAEPETTLDYLTRRLQNIKRLKPEPGTEREPVTFEVGRSANFVTPTMAEIYVGQGEYREAISAYNELIRQNPSEEKLKKRLAEVQQLMQMQEKDAQNTKAPS